MKKVVPQAGYPLRPQALPSAAEVLSNDTWLCAHLMRPKLVYKIKIVCSPLNIFSVNPLKNSLLLERKWVLLGF